MFEKPKRSVLWIFKNLFVGIVAGIISGLIIARVQTQVAKRSFVDNLKAEVVYNLKVIRSFDELSMPLYEDQLTTNAKDLQWITYKSIFTEEEQKNIEEFYFNISRLRTIIFRLWDAASRGNNDLSKTLLSTWHTLGNQNIEIGILTSDILANKRIVNFLSFANK